MLTSHSEKSQLNHTYEQGEQKGAPQAVTVIFGSSRCRLTFNQQNCKVWSWLQGLCHVRGVPASTHLPGAVWLLAG